jgi:hypothetical protein
MTESSENMSPPTTEDIINLMRGHKINHKISLDLDQRIFLEIGRMQHIIASRLGWLLAIIAVLIILQVLASCGTLLR